MTINTQEIIALEKQYLLQTYKRPDLVLERGEGSWLYDAQGRQYLDAGAGIAVTALGHHHEAVIEAIRQGAEGLIHSSNLYHTAPQALLARDLCESSFADRVFFCNSGTEANEGALKFARKYARATSRPDKTGIVAFSGSFHGRTMGALAVTATVKYRAPFEPLIGGVTFAEFNNLDSARQVITEQIGAVIVEPVQGEGGVTPAEPEFLTGLRALCDERGALLIFDEIQCGLGRTGKLWAYENYGVTPDLMTLAKPLAGGLPIGAVLLTQAVAETLEVGDHGSTFAAGPLVCSVARVVFNQINQPHFLAEVKAKGDYLGEKLATVVAQSPLLAGRRGRGLMWGLLSEIPAAEIVAEARNHGLIILVAGERVVRLLPPLTITRAELDMLIERLSKTVTAVG
ncbi:MAG: aspartate aminotransferase family protein [Anaerolineales bacterium]|nr:aspartate aminotransferase family protein [Anaerolineales bacterium]